MSNNKIQSIGDRIKLAREKLGFSQSELSELMCLSRTMCGQWERGTSNPSTLHLSRLADLLDVSFEYLAKGNTTIKNKQGIIDLVDLEIQEKIIDKKVVKIIQQMPFSQKQNLLNFLIDVNK